MSTHRGRKRAVLIPACDQLVIVVVLSDDIARIGRIEERWMLGRMLLRRHLPAPDVVTPIGKARCREIETGRHLSLQSLPRRIDIRRPEETSVALRSQIRRASQDEVAKIGAIAPRAFRDTL